MIWTRAYWRAATERAISAGAAAATAGVTVDSLDGLSVGALRAGALAFVVGAGFSIVKGLAANATNNGLGPGFGDAEATAPAVVLPDEDGQARGTNTPPAEPDDPEAAVTTAPAVVPETTTPLGFAALSDPADQWQPRGYTTPTYDETEPLAGRDATRRKDTP